MPRVLRNYEYENFSYLLEEFNSNKSDPTELHSEEFTLRIERENSEQGILAKKKRREEKGPVYYLTYPIVLCMTKMIRSYMTGIQNALRKLKTGILGC